MAQKPLSEQFAFGRDTPIIGNLTKLVAAIDARFAALEQMEEKVNAMLDGVVSLALQRMNETFTPLIVEAQQRLEQFGAAFGATSQSTLDVSLGPKTLVIDEARRAGFIYSDYVALRAIENDAISMLGHVTDYQRDSGELSVDVVQVPEEVGASYTGWKVNISAAPDLAHAGRTDNPHHTTAEQVGSYTTAQTDAVVASAVAGAQDAINNYINGLGFMRQSLNLNDLVDKAAARANLGVVNKAGDTISGALTVGGDLTASGALTVNGAGRFKNFLNVGQNSVASTSGDLGVSRNAAPTTGLIMFGNSGARYLYFDGASYIFSGAHAYSAAGRLWGTNDFSSPVYSVRLVYISDTYGLEPWAGAVVTGLNFSTTRVLGDASDYRYCVNAITCRYRWLQTAIAGTWYTVGTA